MSSDNVNVSANSDLETGIKYVCYLIVLSLGLCILADAITHVSSYFLSYRRIDSIMQIFSKHPPHTVPPAQYQPQFDTLNRLKNQYFTENGFTGSEFSLEFADTQDINASITTTKQIFFTKGLLDHISEEDVLFFILAHEIGHYKNKDAFKSLARSILFTLVAGFLSQDTASNTASSMMLHYSRSAELAADCFAAQKVQQVYGTSDSGEKFFKYLEKNEPMPAWQSYLSTHPNHIKRLKHLKKCAP